MNLETTLAALLVLLAGLALGAVGGVLWARGRPAHVEAVVDARSERAELTQGLDRLLDQMRDLEQQRASWQGQLGQQVLDMRHTTDTLRRETQTLATALRRPQVRGRWGELHLRRVVELAGMVDRCDFEEQVPLDGGALRPDLVVHLAGGRQVVVDAKVPLEAFLDATGTDDPDRHEHHLARHARQLRQHVEALAAKSYWRALSTSPEFVVLFVPAESFLSAALEADPRLLDDAAARQVVLATPTTLIALLRTAALGWRQEALSRQTDEVHRLGRELHGRLITFVGHLDQVGAALDRATGRYNDAVGSLDRRVLVSARRLADLDVVGEELEAPRLVEVRTLPRRAADHDDPPAPSVAR